jgi:RimJ/RimL family protein N-acetyltransferase
MFVSQKSFWQLDARIFLFTLSPAGNSPFPSASPYPSRPSSPTRQGLSNAMTPTGIGTDGGHPIANHTHHDGMWSPTTPSPFASASHLPTFYPPPPTQYILTNHVRHPLRPKPPRMGETFYTRYVPSVGQYLSFRTASLSRKTVIHTGPISTNQPSFLPPGSAVAPSMPSSALGNMTLSGCDLDQLNNWMNDERVSKFWGVAGPMATQEQHLNSALMEKHSFPAIGCWDGKPFGYFEIYWVKEDRLGKYMTPSEVGNWDRGFHALVGEQEFRGKQRAHIWMSALVHYCFLADSRTERVLCEPRLDNHK